MEVRKWAKLVIDWVSHAQSSRKVEDQDQLSTTSPPPETGRKGSHGEATECPPWSRGGHVPSRWRLWEYTAKGRWESFG